MHVDAFASDLARKGVSVGQRVAVWLPSRAETVIALLACSRNGYVCSPSLHRDHTVGDAIDLLKAHACDRNRRRRGVRCRRHEKRFVRAAVRSGDRRSTSISSRKMAVGREVGIVAVPPVDAPRPPTVKRQPRRLSRLHVRYDRCAKRRDAQRQHAPGQRPCTVVRLDHQRRTSVVYSLSPLSHNLGFGAMIMALAVGGQFVIHDLPRGRSLVDRLIETGTTFLVGVPTHAIDLLAEVQIP